MTFNNKYLSKKVIPFDPTQIENPDQLLENLKFCGFQGRNLGIAADILQNMFLDDDCLTILSLSGAMIPAGMGELICECLSNDLIDVIVSTGANITHDFIDAVKGVGHYLGASNVNDEQLYLNRINRIYDIFLPEDNYDDAEKRLLNIMLKLFPKREIEITPSEFLRLIGSEIKTSSILSIAAKKSIPIFVPAISDSELALDLVKFTEIYDYEIDFRVLKDVKNLANIVSEADSCGTFIIGGGTPRNWTQQIFPYLENLNGEPREGSEYGYKYSVRIHTATEYDGGLSGCTLSESKSWGKYALDARYISIWCDATIALPILITGVLQRMGIV
jgi:deoxyhypusine synthase